MYLTSDGRWHRTHPTSPAGSLAECHGRDWRLLSIAGGDGRWRAAESHVAAKLAAETAAADYLAAKQAAIALGRRGGRAGTGASQLRGDSAHYSQVGKMGGRPRTTIYVVYRDGANAANQSLAPSAVVGVYDERSRQAALAKAEAEAEAGRFTVYAGQRLRVELASKLSEAQRTEAYEHDARETELVAAECCLCGRRGRAKIEAWRAQSWRCAQCAAD